VPVRMLFPRSIYQFSHHISAVEALNFHSRSLGDHCLERGLAFEVDGGNSPEIDHNRAVPACLPGLIPGRFEFRHARLGQLALHHDLSL